MRRGNRKREPRGETPRQAQLASRVDQISAKGNRSATVGYVRDRDQNHCRLCGRFVQYEIVTIESYGEVHEFVFRSQGGSPTEPTNCVLVCKGCHTLSEPCLHPGVGHTSRRVIVPLDADRLMEAPIVYIDEPFADAA